MAKKRKSKKEVKVLVEDRSAFNCPDCKGEGLKDQFHVCDKCGGTGKLNSELLKYPVGTVILKQDGQYLINERGEEIKQ